MTAIPGVGPQLERAADGTDPRGALVFESLPDDLRNAEDSTQAADFERHRQGVWRFAVALWGTDNPAELERLRRMSDRLLTAAGVGWRSFARPATPTERALLGHIGYEDLPAELITVVSFPTAGVRRRTWPQLETNN